MESSKARNGDGGRVELGDVGYGGRVGLVSV